MRSPQSGKSKWKSLSPGANNEMERRRSTTGTAARVGGRGCSQFMAFGLSTNVPSTLTNLALIGVPKRAPKHAPWFASFSATSGSALGAHKLDRILSDRSRFCPRPGAVANLVTQPAPGADPALPTTVKITGMAGSAPDSINLEIHP